MRDPGFELLWELMRTVVQVIGGTLLVLFAAAVVLPALVIAAFLSLWDWPPLPPQPTRREEDYWATGFWVQRKKGQEKSP